MFASDYPHRYASGVEELTPLLTLEQRELVMGGNARALYGL
jgi:predicted TIM-barrel fold metal-dependent hydrolase